MCDIFGSMFAAASNDDSDAVEEYLSTCGNDVNETDDLGLTGLHRCATNGSVSAAHVYLTYGADTTLADRESGWSALHRSIYFQHVKVTLLMLAFGTALEDSSSSSKSRGESLVDKDGLSPMALLSRILAPNLRIRGDRSTSAVYCFGKSDFTLGIPLPNAPNVTQAKRVETLLDKRVAQLCAGKNHSLAVTQDGHVYAWGYGRWGRLGQGNEADQPEPCILSSLLRERAHVVQVASGENHTIAVTRQGDVFTWGSDRYGQLGHGNSGRSTTGMDKDNDSMVLEPRRVEALRRVCVLQVAAGDAHSLCFAKQDELYAWGSNRSGQLGLKAAELTHLPGGAEGSSVPKMVHIDHAGRPKTSIVSTKIRSRPRAEVMLQIAASHNNSLLLCRTVHLETQAGTMRGTLGSEVFQWGHGIFEPVKVLFGSREFAQSKASAANGFTAVGKTKHVHITQVTAGQHCFAGISTDGCVYTWGVRTDAISDARAAVGPERQAERIDERISARSSLTTPRVLDVMLPEHGGGQVTHISASSSRMSATTADGDVYLWELHRPSGSKAPGGSELAEPRRVVGVKRAVAVSLGPEYTLVLATVSLPPLPLAHCAMYSTAASVEVAMKQDEALSPAVEQEQEDDGSVESADHDAPSTGAFLNLAPEPELSNETSGSSQTRRHSISGSESDGDSDAGNDERNDKIPSLFSICQRQVAKTVNSKSVLSALTFADNFDAKLLSAYCTSYAQMNFDLILTQTKQAEVEKFVEGMGFTLQRRAGVKNHTSPTAASAPHRAGGRAHSGSISESPTKKDNAPPVVAETKVDPDNTEDVKKQMRGIRKKLTAIQELQDKLSAEPAFVLSPQQSEKMQKREQLHREMAHLEQLLVRCEVRERNAGKSLSTSSSISSSASLINGARPVTEEPTELRTVPSVLTAAPASGTGTSSNTPKVGAVPKKKKFPKGMSLQEFHRVISGADTITAVESATKPLPRSSDIKSSSPWGKTAASCCATTDVEPISISLTAGTASASPSKILPGSISCNAGGESSPDTAAISRKTFTLTDFLPGSARKNAPTAAPTVKTAPATPPSKPCWGGPATTSSPSVQSLQGTKPTSVTAKFAATTTAATTARAPTNFSDIQRAEEAARQRSNITSLQGNVIPWYVERRPRAESLENVIRQQALDKAVEEEHQRLKKIYLPEKVAEHTASKKGASKDSRRTGAKKPAAKSAPGAAK